MKKFLTMCASTLISAVVFAQSEIAGATSSVTTQQEFIVNSSGEAIFFSNTQYLSVEEVTLTLNSGNTSTSATLQNDDKTNELLNLLIAGSDQNDINHMLPNIDLGYLSKDSWHIEYTIKNISENTRLTVTDYQITLYAMHYHESGHTAIDGNVVVLLTPGYMDDKHTFTQTEVTLQGSNSTEQAGVSSGTWMSHLAIPFTLDPGESIKLFATVAAPMHNDHEDGHLYIGLENFKLSALAATIVPEPTAAALSLLALSGLLARRRRK